MALGKASELAIGDPLYVIGSPEGLEQTLTEGILSGRRVKGGIEYLQLSAAVSHGSSGSPVFNKYGEVVGMITSSLTDGQQLNFAISLDAISEAHAFGVPVDAVFKQAAPANIQPVSKAAATDSLLDYFLQQVKQNRVSLTGECPDLSLVIELSGKVPAESITAEAVHGWIDAELARSAPNLKILSDVDQQKLSLPVNINPLALLNFHDGKGRHLTVYINTMYNELTHQTFYIVNTELTRGVFSLSGLINTISWRDQDSGYFGSNHDGTTILRNVVQQQMKKFADQWCIDNKKP